MLVIINWTSRLLLGFILLNWCSTLSSSREEGSMSGSTDCSRCLIFEAEAQGRLSSWRASDSECRNGLSQRGLFCARTLRTHCAGLHSAALAEGHWEWSNDESIRQWVGVTTKVSLHQALHQLLLAQERLIKD
eukprot:4986580-Amphidinium_carterae.1